MAFDIFSQPQGANIDVSLFGDATRAGIAAGQALPTTTTSIIQGLTKGVQTGLDIVGEVQNIQIRQNQIDQLPITNQIQIQNLENAKQLGKVRELELQQASQLQGLELENKKITFEASTAKLKEDKLLRERRALFQDAFKASTPEQQAQMLFSGQWNDVFAYDKNLYANTIDIVSANPNTPSDIRNNLQGIKRKTAARTEQEKLQAKYNSDYDKATALLQQKEGGVLGDLSKQSGLSQRDALTYGEWVERDSWVRNPQTGKFERNPAFQRQPEAPVWDYKVTDPRNGKTSIITQGLTDDRKKLFDTQAAAESLASGRDLRAKEQLIDAETKKQNQQMFQPGVNLPSSTGRSYIETEAKNVLDITDNTLNEISPSLTRFYSAIEKQIKEPASDRRFSAIQFRDTVVNSLTRKISDSQYAENKLIQQQYTPADVKKYNDQVFNNLRASRSQLEYNDDELRAAYAPWFVSSPQDLYYNTQKDVLTKQMQKLTDKYMEAAQRSVGSTYNWQSDKNSVVSGLLNRGNGTR